jgi:flavin reductase (DIM6/NTAB) family NADH-FMN oxidoreductase RutF
MGHFATGVTVITASADGTQFGTTASAVMSVSLEPPTLLIAMNRDSMTGRAISRSRQFAVNILAEEQHDLARHFSTKDPEKFSAAQATPGVLGQPLLDGALATLECRVTTIVEGGTHEVLLAEVEAATATDGSPLAYFRGRFERLDLE